MVRLTRLVMILITSPHNLGPAFLLRDLGDLSPGNPRTFLNQSGAAILYWDLRLHLFWKLRALRLEGLLTNLLRDVLTACSRDNLCLSILMFSADLGRHLLAPLSRLGGVGALRPLQGLALSGHHILADGIEHLLLHQHRDWQADSPGHVLTLRHGDVLTHHLGDINTHFLGYQNLRTSRTWS